MKQIIWATKLQGWCRHPWKMTRLKLQIEKKLEVILFCVSRFLSLSLCYRSSHIFSKHDVSPRSESFANLRTVNYFLKILLHFFFRFGDTCAHRRENTRGTLPLVSYLPKLLRNFVIQCGTLIILSFNFRLSNFRLTTGVEALFNWLFNYAGRFIRGVNTCLNVMSIQRICRNNPDIFVVNVLATNSGIVIQWSKQIYYLMIIAIIIDN